jgi:hypothetical protein
MNHTPAFWSLSTTEILQQLLTTKEGLVLAKAWVLAKGAKAWVGAAAESSKPALKLSRACGIKTVVFAGRGNGSFRRFGGSFAERRNQ